VLRKDGGNHLGVMLSLTRKIRFQRKGTFRSMVEHECTACASRPVDLQHGPHQKPVI
jgi:hypothetical protein